MLRELDVVHVTGIGKYHVRPKGIHPLVRPVVPSSSRRRVVISYFQIYRNLQL